MRCTKMRGKKGVPHTDPDDPPRRRGRKKGGHGNWNNDRPPVVGVVGRSSEQVRLEVAHRPWAPETAGLVVSQTEPGTMVNTDDWSAYKCLPTEDRRHATVVHLKYEWARDDDGDGVREVHVNTM
jgi:transposase